MLYTTYMKQDKADTKKKVAVFDVDGTIFRSSLLIEVVEVCIQNGLFPAEAREAYTAEYDSWQNREGEYHEYIMAVVDSFMTHIKGVFYGDFVELARKTLEEQQNRTYRYTRDLVVKLKKDGYFLLAISHSPKTILDIFCPAMGFDKVYGMLYEIGPSDKFTGVVSDQSFILNKAAVLKRAIEKEGLSFQGSIGVGDTESDISFLELVEQPICFNPNSGLYKVAKSRKWKVVVERKDVIYEIEP
jgi:HAD superfamily phosphoserine phosphatase-like hydrolase